MGWGGKFIGENLWGPQEMGWEREQGILPQVFYSRAHEAGYRIGGGEWRFLLLQALLPLILISVLFMKKNDSPFL